MTDTELRKLDAEVAEKVMGLVPCDGWKSMNFGSAGGPALRKDCSHADDECYPTATMESVYGTVSGCPQYSSRIAAAMSVADHLIAKGHGLDMQAWIAPQRTKGTWRVDFESDDEGDTVTHGFVYSDSLPEAICRAALNVIESRDE